MKTQKVIILIGLPASGKSTWAKKHVANNHNFVIVSRDSFREMMRNQQVCEHKIEDLITELVDDVIIKSLLKNQNVIVDNTNLKLTYINHFINLVKDYADVEYIMFDTSVDKCIDRDNNRDKKVGEKVIKKMNKDLINLKQVFDFQPVKKNKNRETIVPNFDSQLKNAIVFDVDGTLAIMNNRGPFDWKKVDNDLPNDIVLEHIKFHKSLGREIIIMSGRDSICKDLTKEWLDFFGIEYDHIFMRKEGDYRKDSIIKKELYEDNIKDKFNLLCVYDDRIQVVKMWYDLGIFCFNVNQGNKLF